MSNNILNEFIDGDINSMNLKDVIDMLAKKWNSLTVAQKIKYIRYIAGTR